MRFAEQRQKPLKLVIDAFEDQSSTSSSESLQSNEKPSTPTPEREDRGESSSDDILNTLPKTFRNKGSVLLKRLQKNDRIKWGRDGKVKIEGKAIEGSNIADLVNDAMRNRKNSRIPTGHREFYSVLAKMNVPQELIGNPERWELIRNFASQGLSPDSPAYAALWPPTPVKRSRSAETPKVGAVRKKLSWEKFLV